MIINSLISILFGILIGILLNINLCVEHAPNSNIIRNLIFEEEGKYYKYVPKLI